RGFCALLHSKGNDTKRLEWSFHAGHCWHGAFNSDVICARGTTADTHAATSPRLPVIGRAARNSVLQVGSFQDLLLPERLKSLLSQPTVQPFDPAVAQPRRFHHSAIEQDMCGTGESAGAAADARCLGTVANLLREKARQVLGDGGIGCVRQAQLLKTHTAAGGRAVHPFHFLEQTLPHESVL